MTDYYGGQRARLIKKSVYEFLKSGLEDLGWFDDGRNHESVRFEARPVTDFINTKLSEDLRPNIITLTDEDDESSELELGSSSRTFRWEFFVDIFAENPSVGIGLSTDIRDILLGLHDSNVVDDQGPVLDVYDYAQATPSVLFSCQLVDVEKNRVKVWEKPWQKYWYIVPLS